MRMDRIDFLGVYDEIGRLLDVEEMHDIIESKSLLIVNGNVGELYNDNHGYELLHEIVMRGNDGGDCILNVLSSYYDDLEEVTYILASSK